MSCVRIVAFAAVGLGLGLMPGPILAQSVDIGHNRAGHAFVDPVEKLDAFFERRGSDECTGRFGV